MLLNIHCFLEPLPIGIPSHWLFASRSRFFFFHGGLLSSAPRHPIIADHHDTPAVTGGLHPLLDISPNNRTYPGQEVDQEYYVRGTLDK